MYVKSLSQDFLIPSNNWRFSYLEDKLINHYKNGSKIEAQFSKYPIIEANREMNPTIQPKTKKNWHSSWNMNQLSDSKYVNTVIDLNTIILKKNFY